VSDASECCALCAEFGAVPPLEIKVDGVNLGNRILKQCEDLLLIPTLGPLADGHCLICTKSHHISFGHFLGSGGNQGELELFVSDVKQNLGDIYGKPTIIFEHGPNASGSLLGCGTDHAHLHVVPTDADLMNDDDLKLRDWKPCSLTDLHRYRDIGLGYLFYINQQGNGFICLVEESISSQTFRKALAGALGRGSEWNWREFPQAESVEKTIQLYREAAIREHHSCLTA